MGTFKLGNPGHAVLLGPTVLLSESVKMELTVFWLFSNP